jgi:probable HAF family extracellular repeat protein
MRGFVLLVAGFIAALALVGCVGGGDKGATTTTDASKPATKVNGRWMITDLGTLGEEPCEAFAINDRGQVVGYSYRRSPIAGEHPFLWQDGKMADLGGLHRGWDTQALDINERGQIVGHTSTLDAGGSEVRWRSLVWENGKMTTLPSGGRANQAAAINDRGQVVGWADLRRVVGRGEDGPAFPVRRAALWQAGTMRFLRIPRADSEATGLNEVGQVIGMMGDWERGFVWQNGRAHDLGRLGDDGWLSAINDRGQIVGRRNGRATLWEKGVPRRLGHPSASKGSSEATDVNERGRIVGWWRRGDPWIYRAVLWEKGKPTLLPNLPGGAGGTAFGINERGQIVGSAETKGDETHAVLWTLKP